MKKTTALQRIQLSKRPHLARGFTLIEVLLAITILSIVSGFAIPRLYGAYQRQQLLNSANEIVTTISQARAYAQANNQQSYAKSTDNPAKPYGPCDMLPHATGAPATYSYIGFYTVTLESAQNYAIKPALKSGSGCDSSGSPAAVQTKAIPSPLTISTAESVGMPLKYTTTTGTISFAGGGSSAQIVIVANGPLGNLKYYVCVNSEKTVAQATPC